MITSENGVKLIKSSEGLKLNAYQCSAGKWTIGYGHTSGVKAGDKITKEQAEEFFKEDLRSVEYCIQTEVERELNQNQHDALASFIFNIGSFKFRHSTLLRQLNYGNFERAAEQFDRWVYVKGKKNQGLINRRKAEKELFLKKV